MLQQAVAVFVENRHEIVHIASSDALEFKNLGQAVVYLLQRNFAISIDVEEAEGVDEVEILAAG